AQGEPELLVDRALPHRHDQVGDFHRQDARQRSPATGAYSQVASGGATFVRNMRLWQFEPVGVSIGPAVPAPSTGWTAWGPTPQPPPVRVLPVICSVTASLPISRSPRIPFVTHGRRKYSQAPPVPSVWQTSSPRTSAQNSSAKPVRQAMLQSS